MRQVSLCFRSCATPCLPCHSRHMIAFQLVLISAAITALAGPWVMRATFGLAAARTFVGIIVVALLLAASAYFFLHQSDGHGAAALGFVLLAAITLGCRGASVKVVNPFK